MKAESLWVFTIVATLSAAAVLPSNEPMEARAAQFVAPRVPDCDNTTCLAGWKAAQDAELNDMDECPRVVTGVAELAGCKAFVQWARDEVDMQALVERGL